MGRIVKRIGKGRNRRLEVLEKKSRGVMGRWDILPLHLVEMLRPGKKTDLKKVEEGIKQRGYVARPDSVISFWRKTAEKLENEGFWEPLIINDVKGFLNEISAVDRVAAPYRRGGFVGNEVSLGSREFAKMRGKVMELFLELVEGRRGGDKYSAEKRGMNSTALRNETVDRIGLTPGYFYRILNDLQGMGALRRAGRTAFVMIPTKAQMDEFFAMHSREVLERLGEVGKAAMRA